jgi:hypothetical protein
VVPPLLAHAPKLRLWLASSSPRPRRPLASIQGARPRRDQLDARAGINRPACSSAAVCSDQCARAATVSPFGTSTGNRKHLRKNVESGCGRPTRVTARVPTDLRSLTHPPLQGRAAVLVSRVLSGRRARRRHHHSMVVSMGGGPPCALPTAGDRARSVYALRGLGLTGNGWARMLESRRGSAAPKGGADGGAPMPTGPPGASCPHRTTRPLLRYEPGMALPWLMGCLPVRPQPITTVAFMREIARCRVRCCSRRIGRTATARDDSGRGKPGSSRPLARFQRHLLPPNPDSLYPDRIPPPR